MKAKFFIAALLLISLVSCKSKQALDFNDKIVKMERDLQPELTKTESDISAHYNKGDYPAIAATAAKMEGLVEKKLEEIKGLSTSGIKGADELKTAFIDYFTYIKKIYTGYRECGEATTDEDRQAKMAAVADMGSTQGQVISDIQAAQQKFATTNGFRMEKK